MSSKKDLCVFLTGSKFNLEATGFAVLIFWKALQYYFSFGVGAMPRNATGLAVFGALCCVFVREKQVAGLQLDRHQNRKKRWACRMLDLRNVKGQTNDGSYMYVPENACLVSFMHA